MKGYIDSVTCNSVTFPSEYSDTECGDNAASYYKEFIYNNKRVIISNNVRQDNFIIALLYIFIPDPRPPCRKRCNLSQSQYTMCWLAVHGGSHRPQQGEIPPPLPPSPPVIHHHILRAAPSLTPGWELWAWQSLAVSSSTTSPTPTARWP